MQHSARRKVQRTIAITKVLILIIWLSIIFLSDFVKPAESKRGRKHFINNRSALSNVVSKRKENRDDYENSRSLSKSSLKRDISNANIKPRRIILPAKKESLTSKALRSIEGLKNTLQSSADAALCSSSKVQRQLKSYFSSDFEVLILRMTAPDDSRLSDDDLQRFVATIETFVRNMDVTSQSNPYRVTLRKIWAKAAESDGRTVLKSQFLLHTLLRGTTPEDSLIFKTLLKKMHREKCKKTKSKYFDIVKIASVSDETEHLKDYIERYSVYIFQRAKTFTSCFEEMKLIGDGMRTEDICAQLMKAVKVLNTALNCGATTIDEECSIVLACSELVANDVRDLFTLFHTKLLWVLNEEKVGDIFIGWEIAEVRAILSHLKTFYSDRFEDIQDLLIETAEILKRQCGNLLPTSLPTPAIFEDPSPGVYKSRNFGSQYPSISHLESSSSGGDSASSSFSSFGTTEDSSR